jgi:hypothetical protein
VRQHGFLNNRRKYTAAVKGITVRQHGFLNNTLLCIQLISKGDTTTINHANCTPTHPRSTDDGRKYAAAVKGGKGEYNKVRDIDGHNNAAAVKGGKGSTTR